MPAVVSACGIASNFTFQVRAPPGTLDMLDVPNVRLRFSSNDFTSISRLCWLVALVASVLGGILLIIQLVYRFQSGSACVTTLHTTNYPIWNVAFPAVTLCNENKIYKPLVYKVVSQL